MTLPNLLIKLIIPTHIRIHLLTNTKISVLNSSVQDLCLIHRTGDFSCHPHCVLLHLTSSYNSQNQTVVQTDLLYTLGINSY